MFTLNIVQTRMIDFNSSINRLNFALSFFPFCRKRGCGSTASTLDDVVHCDWLTDIRSNNTVHFGLKGVEEMKQM